MGGHKQTRTGKHLAKNLKIDLKNSISIVIAKPVLEAIDVKLAKIKAPSGSSTQLDDE